MSHNIIDNMISWKDEQPWHGLGTQVNPDATGIEMLRAAKMDWLVQRRALAMRDAMGNGLLTAPLQGFSAIVRADNNTVFQVATNRYHPVQNHDIIEVFREYCALGHARMETVGALHGGSIVWALARLNSGTTKTIQGNDELRGYLLMATSHDGTVRTIAKATQVRVVCWNTLSAALGEGSIAFSMKHSKKYSDAVKDEIRASLGIAVEKIQATNEAADMLSRITINNDDWLDFMTQLLGSKDAVIDPKANQLTAIAQGIKTSTISAPGQQLKSAKGTLWGAVNGVTHYADHVRGRTDDNRLASAWFGDSDGLKLRALETAMAMAA